MFAIKFEGRFYTSIQLLSDHVVAKYGSWYEAGNLVQKERDLGVINSLAVINASLLVESEAGVFECEEELPE